MVELPDDPPEICANCAFWLMDNFQSGRCQKREKRDPDFGVYLVPTEAANRCPAFKMTDGIVHVPSVFSKTANNGKQVRRCFQCSHIGKDSNNLFYCDLYAPFGKGVSHNEYRPHATLCPYFDGVRDQIPRTWRVLFLCSPESFNDEVFAFSKLGDINE